MPDLVPEWYHNKRKLLKDAYTMGTMHVNHSVEATSGKYTLNVVPFEFSDNSWYYSKAVVFKDDLIPVSSLIRNYGNFPFFWVAKHPKKRKYLVCSENTQGITVIDLISGKIHTWIDEEDDFWPRAYTVNPCGDTLAVFGSKLGELDKVRLYDFSTPIRFPYTLLAEFESGFMCDETNKIVHMTSMITWEPNNGPLRITCESEHPDGVMVDDFLLYTDGVYEHVDHDLVEP